MNLLADAFQQRQADTFLKLLDLCKHGRLGEVKLLRRARVGKMTGDGFEDMDLPQAQVHEFILVKYKTKINSVLVSVMFAHNPSNPKPVGRDFR